MSNPVSAGERPGERPGQGPGERPGGRPVSSPAQGEEGKKRMRIVADTTRCVGAGQCVLSEPKVFDQSEDDGTVVLLRERPGEDEVEGVHEALDLCPSQALSLEED